MTLLAACNLLVETVGNPADKSDRARLSSHSLISLITYVLCDPASCIQLDCRDGRSHPMSVTRLASLPVSPPQSLTSFIIYVLAPETP